MNKLFNKGDCPEIRRLMKYEKLKYKFYNNLILNDDGLPDIMKTITDTKNRLDNSIQKINKIELGKTPKIAKHGGTVENVVQEILNSSSDEMEDIIVKDDDA
jgi:hypothetical protein